MCSLSRLNVPIKLHIIRASSIEIYFVCRQCLLGIKITLKVFNSYEKKFEIMKTVPFYY